MPLERLEAQICELAGHLTAATCRFLLMIGDFDARRGWESWDLPSCSAWLAWKCCLTPGTAREHVRVARALRGLPVTRAEFAAGRLSYAKVRALTRIATPATESVLAEMARPMTGGQLERFARAHRQVSRAKDRAVRAARRVTWRVDGEDGSVAMTVRLPAAEGQVVIQALRAAAADVEHPHDAGHDDVPASASPTSGGGSRPGSDPGPKSPGLDRNPAFATSTASAASPQPDADCAPGAGAGPGAAQSAGPAVSGAGGVSAETPESPEQDSPEAAGLADALAGIAADYLAGKIAAAANPDIYQVIVHVGAEALITPDTEPDPAPGHDQASGRARSSAVTPGPDPASAPARPGGPGPATRPAGVSAETPPATSPAAGQPATAGQADTGDPEDACRPDCPYRHIGHPAHPRRCHLEDGPALSHATAQRIACAATISWMLHDHDGTLLDTGRRHRTPTPALRRAVRERDQYRCRFPGCHSRRTDLHHIRHWARGGQTRLTNLICLCQAHHVIVHELGYLITAGDTGGFTFTRPDGTPMPASPGLPDPTGGDITGTHDAVITPDTVQGTGERMDLHLTVWTAFADARIAAEGAARAAAQ